MLGSRGALVPRFAHPFLPVQSIFGGGQMRGSDWRLAPEDIAKLVIDLLDFPARALPSLIEIRPTRPPKK